MFIYFLFIRIAALFGHRKAKKMLEGHAATKSQLAQWKAHPRSVHPIWIHAASTGEFEQARPLIERIKASHPHEQIVVTFFSPSGYELRKNYELADGVYYLPFATRRNAKRFLEALRPRMAVFVKYEFWPAYIRELKKRAIPLYSICAIFRPEQYFFRFWGKGQLKHLRSFTHIFVQDESSRRLLAEHAVHNASVAGDTRFDRMYELVEQKKYQALSSEPRLAPFVEFSEGFERVLVAGSTWPEDEKLMEQLVARWSCDSSMTHKLILVPHELNEEHLHFIFNLFQGRMVKYSAVSGQQSAVSRRNLLQHAQVLLVDEMGLLSSIYPFGHVAYIGGGFGAGIHNTIEAAAYGMPVLFGPNYHHFREAQGLIDAGAGRSVKKFSELAEAVEDAFVRQAETGAKAAAYVQSELGATEKILKELRIENY